MPSDAQQARRDQHPIAEAVFAMYRWPNAYAASGVGCMTFYENYLNEQDRTYCRDAVKAILAAGGPDAQ